MAEHAAAAALILAESDSSSSDGLPLLRSLPGPGGARRGRRTYRVTAPSPARSREGARWPVLVVAAVGAVVLFVSGFSAGWLSSRGGSTDASGVSAADVPRMLKCVAAAARRRVALPCFPLLLLHGAGRPLLGRPSLSSSPWCDSPCDSIPVTCIPLAGRPTLPWPLPLRVLVESDGTGSY